MSEPPIEPAPKIDADQTDAPTSVKALATPAPRLSRRSGLDAEIEKELEAALGGMDAAAMYGEPERPGASRKPPAPASQRKKGRVVGIHGDDIFIDVGGRSQGVLSAIQFPEGPPERGAEVDVVIQGYDSANGLLLLSIAGSAVQADWSSVAEGMIVEARVVGDNKGGLQVDVNGIRGFIPVSHIDLYRVEDMKPYLNQRLRCLVTEVNPAERNLVLSRRALLEKEREEAREKLWQELAEGQVRTGIVRSVKDFGAFIDLGGVDGLLHVSQMSWTHTENAANLVQPGQQLQVAILKLDPERRKVSLGLKQLLPSPWDKIDEQFPEGSVVGGKVTRLMDFGAFVELAPGIEGLVHISEAAPQRIRRVSEVVQPGQEVKVKVLKVDRSQQRISLSIKAAVKEEPEEVEEIPEAEKKPLPQRKTPLKGGIG